MLAGCTWQSSWTTRTLHACGCILTARTLLRCDFWLSLFPLCCSFESCAPHSWGRWSLTAAGSEASQQAEAESGVLCKARKGGGHCRERRVVGASSAPAQPCERTKERLCCSHPSSAERGGARRSPLASWARRRWRRWPRSAARSRCRCCAARPCRPAAPSWWRATWRTRCASSPTRARPRQPLRLGLLAEYTHALLDRQPVGAEALRARAAAVALGHVRGQTVLPLPPADALAGGAGAEGLRLLEAAVEAWVRQVKPLLKADPGDAPPVRLQLPDLPVHQDFWICSQGKCAGPGGGRGVRPAGRARVLGAARGGPGRRGGAAERARGCKRNRRAGGCAIHTRDCAGQVGPHPPCACLTLI